METKYVFIIDTDQYAGNFERPMCAYLTGTIGECEVGEEEAKKFKEKFGEEKQEEIEDLIERRPDDHGCSRPTTIWLTPKKYKTESYCSVAIFFNEKPTEEIIKMMKERAEEFVSNRKTRYNNDPKIKILGFRLTKETTTYETEDIEI